MFSDLIFNSFQFNNREQILIGVDVENKYVAKIEIIKNTKKERDIKQEYEILKLLNQKGSRTCPAVYEFGKVSKDQIYEKVNKKEILDQSGSEEYYYILQDYIPNDEKPKLADIILSMLEQKNLGVYQGDIKWDNVRFDSSKSICYIIDYDQAILLNEEQTNFSNSKFLNFCSVYDKQKYGFGDWLRHFPEFSDEKVQNLFEKDKFNLGSTTIFQTQVTTNSETGFYHTIVDRDIFIKGSRNISDRAKLLNNLNFKKEEKVLDIGCNAGLLCMYLNYRGCSVTGVDNDARITYASKIIANIMGKDINYSHMDLDYLDSIDKYDTVMLFSVLHHTRDVVKNAEKVANSCSRIILEARLFENGKQPINGKWMDTSRWNFGNIEELIKFCEKIFVGFKLRNNLGIGSKNRYILEFIKE